MGRIIFLGDLHGNMVATEAMAKTIEKIAPDEIWFLGDAVGKGPSNCETCDWVKENCDHFLKGNWDEWIIDSYLKRENKHSRYAEENRFFYDQLGEKRLMWLQSLPYEDEILISGIRFRLLHGRPSDNLYQGFDSDEWLKQGFYSQAKQTKYDSYICADSHRPYVRSLHDGYAINTGSIGNSIGMPRAHALLVEGDVGQKELSPISFSILSVPYDNQKAADIALSTEGLPHAEAFAREVKTGIYSRE